METWHKIYRHSIEITPVEVARSTPYNLILPNGRTLHKHNSYDDYLPSREAAKAALIVRSEIRIQNAQASLMEAQKELEQAKAL